MANLISGLYTAMRPVAKELIKRGLVAIDTCTVFVAETGEHFKDLIAEVKTEMASEEKEKNPGTEKNLKDATIPTNGTPRQPH